MSEDYASVLSRYNYQVEEDKNQALMQSMKSDRTDAEKDTESEIALPIGAQMLEKATGYLKDKALEGAKALKDNITKTWEDFSADAGKSAEKIFTGKQSVTDKAIEDLGENDKAGYLRNKFNEIKSEYQSASADLEKAKALPVDADAEVRIANLQSQHLAESRLAGINAKANSLSNEVTQTTQYVRTNVKNLDIVANRPVFESTTQNPAFDYGSNAYDQALKDNMSKELAFEDPLVSASGDVGTMSKVQFGEVENYASDAVRGIVRVPVLPTTAIVQPVATIAPKAVIAPRLATEDILGQGGLGTRIGAAANEIKQSATQSVTKLINNPLGSTAAKAAEVSRVGAANQAGAEAINAENIASGAETVGETAGEIAAGAGEDAATLGVDDIAVAGIGASFGPIGTAIAGVAILGAALWHLFDPDDSKPAVIPTPNYSNPVFQPGGH